MNSAFDPKNLNGLPADVPLTMAPIGNPDVIRLLEQVLQEAKAGRLAAVALVTVAGPGRVGMSWAGGMASEVNLGVDHLKDAVLSSTKPQRSNILRPVG